MNVCPQCAQDNPEVAQFCLACGSPLAAPEPLAEERKLITVLFCDIVGSTAAAEKLDPEDVRARLAPYYARTKSSSSAMAERSRSSSATPLSRFSELRSHTRTIPNVQCALPLRSVRRSTT